MFGKIVRFLLLFAALFKLLLFSSGSGDESGEKGTPAPDQSGEGFTQADLDRIAGDARKQGRQSALKEFLAELGFEKPDDLKTLIADTRKRQEAELSEAEKARREAEAEIKKRQALEAEYNQLKAERQQERLDRAVESALQKASAKKPADVLDLMKVRGRLANLLTDEGQVDEKALAAVIEDFKKNNVEYFGSGNPGSPSNSGAKPPVPSGEKLQNAVKEHMRRLSGS